MSEIDEQLARLRNFNALVLRDDPELAKESAERAAGPAVETLQTPDQNIGLESIVLKRNRPVLAIRDNTAVIEFEDLDDNTVWKARLTKAASLLDIPIRAVGRIDLQGARLDWVGTGWLVAENIMVTNRHVAREFALRKGDGYTFQTGLNGQMTADIDFLQEIGNPKQLIFKLIRPLHIEEEPGPDLSFFEVEVTSGDSKLARHIDLATEIVTTQIVATIGYPAYDSRIPDPALMQ
jgi:endonuclease G